jgi:hypothetical protein
MYHRVRSSFVFGHGEDGPRAIVIRSRGDNSLKFNGHGLSELHKRSGVNKTAHGCEIFRAADIR